MIRTPVSVVLLMVVGLVAIGPEPAWGDFAHLTLQSEAGDFVGGGKNFDLTYDSTAGEMIQARAWNPQLANGEPSVLRFILDQHGATNTFALIEFGTDKIPLPFQAGTYLNAQRAAFADPGSPGLDVNFQNRGGNKLTGQFTVNSVSFYRDGLNNNQIGSLDVSFTQRVDISTGSLRGRFVYQSSVVPEPSALVLMAVGTLGLLGYGRYHRRLTLVRIRDRTSNEA
jgi:hypothetical protein